MIRGNAPALKTYSGKYHNFYIVYCADLMLNVSAVTSVVKKAIAHLHVMYLSCISPSKKLKKGSSAVNNKKISQAALCSR